MDVTSLIRAIARQYGVPEDLALRVARQESGYRQDAIGPSGEIGVFQLMPATARELGVDPFDLRQNIEGGVRYLRQQYDRFGSWELAVAAYNAGPGAVAAGRIPAEYVESVFGRPVFSIDVEAKPIEAPWWALAAALAAILWLRSDHEGHKSDYVG